MTDESFTILVAEDNPDDFLLLQRALAKNHIANPVQWVQDGLDAIDYLSGNAPYADRAQFPLPRVVMLDLKMPRFGGFELLNWIRNHPGLHLLPVLIMSSSNLAPDVAKAYALGANSFFMKPSTFDDLQKLTRSIHDYWVRCVIPRHEPGPSPETHDLQETA
jgi:CheY-like chemotaxis protein